MTDTRGEIDFFHPDENMPGWVWAIDIGSGAKELMLDSGRVFINGLGFSPDGARLIVTATSSAQLVAYDAAGLDHAAGEVLCTFVNGWPDGMAVDRGGDMWVALTAGDRLDRVDAACQILASAALPTGALPTNVCFSGAQPDELYVTASFIQSLVRIKL